MTAVETGVARLVAAGLRNREVAAELFMSSDRRVPSDPYLPEARSPVRTELGTVLARREPPEGVGGNNGTPGRH